MIQCIPVSAVFGVVLPAVRYGFKPNKCNFLGLFEDVPLGGLLFIYLFIHLFMMIMTIIIF